MLNVCIRPEVSKNFARKVVNKLTQEQLEKYAISEEGSKERAIKAIADLVASHIVNAESEEKQNQMLNDIDGFISLLDNYFMVTKVAEDKFENVQEQYNQFINDNIESLGGRIGSVEIEDSNENRPFIKSVVEVFDCYRDFLSYRKTERIEEGQKIIALSWILKEPVKEDKSSQQKSLDTIDRINSIGSQYLGAEIAKDGDEKEVQYIGWGKTPEEGWHRTGRSRYRYGNQIIITQSVTPYDPDGRYPILSAPLGTHIDSVGRMVFDEGSELWENGKLVSDTTLQFIIDNNLGGIFTVEGLKNLIGDFQKLKKQLQTRWPECKFFTGELKMFGKTSEKSPTGEEIWNVGKPDLLAIDTDGTIHVIDFKSYKMTSIKGYQTFSADRAEKYGKQVSSYIRLLQSYGLDVDEHPYIVQIDTWYESSDLGEYNTDERNSYYYNDNGTLGILEGKAGNEERITLGQYAQENPTSREEILTDDAALTKDILYMEPRLHLGYDEEKGFSSTLKALRSDWERDGSGIRFHEEISYQQQWEALLDEERDQMEWLFGNPVHMHTAQGVVTLPAQDIESRPDIISSQEIQDMADIVMQQVSRIITWLIGGKSFKNIPLSQPMEKGRKVTPLTGRSREEIIRLVGIQPIIDNAFSRITSHYKNRFPSYNEYQNGAFDDNVYEFESDEDYWQQRKHNEKAKWIIDHKGQFLIAGEQKLMALENTALPIKNKDNEGNETLEENAPEMDIPVDSSEIKIDTGDNEANETFADLYLEGLTDIQAWMIGQRQFSPRASLAKEIRRAFERLLLTDDSGKPIHDPYGWGYTMCVDATTAIQTVYDKCCDCETIEEMITKLRILAETGGNNWVNQLLDKINTDKNFKKKFFRNFRKDELLYSTCEVKFDKKTGKPVVQTRIINMKPAYYVLTQSLEACFRNGSVGRITYQGVTKPLVARSKETGKNEITKIGDISLTSIVRRRARALQSRVEDIYRDYEYYKAEGEDAKRQALEKLLSEPNEKYGGRSIIDSITGMLHVVGILVPTEVVTSLCFSGLKRYRGSMAWKILGKVHDIAASFETQYRTSKSIPDGLAGNNAFNVYAPLLQMLSKHVQEHVEASVYQDGKTYYSFTNPSRLSHIIRNLKNAIGDEDKFEKYLNDNFGRYTGWFKTVDGSQWLNDWIEQFEEHSDAREALRLKSEISYIGTQYKELGSLGFQLSILHNYFGTKDDRSTNSKHRWFALPTMSNKPVNEFVRMLAYRNKDLIIDRVLMRTFQQEMNRIADVLYHYTHNSIATDKMDITDKMLRGAEWSEDEIKGLQDRINNHSILPEDLIRLAQIESGARFHFLWYLNNDIADNKELAERITDRINRLLTPNEEKDSENEAEEAATSKMVRQVIADNMERIVKAELDHMRKIGLFDKETKIINGRKVEILKYQDEFGGLLGSRNNNEKEYGTAEEQMEYELKMFVWEDIAANINIIQITGGDLAYYGNSVNYQKRIAQEHSPGLHAMHDEDYDDGYLRSVYIADSKVRDEIVENTRVALEEYLEENRKSMGAGAIEEYQKMITIITSGLTEALATDGQSFNSPTSIRKKMAMQGEWDENAEKAYKSILNNDFNINNLGVMLQPRKPFVTADMAKYSNSTTMALRRVPVQDKNSEYLLLLADALQRGANKKSKITAIYDFMEKTAQLNDKQGIDTVHFASVNKVGKRGIIDINAFDEQYDGPEEEYSEALTNYMLSKISRNPDADKTLSEEDRELLREQFDKEEEMVSNGILDHREALIYNNQYVNAVPVDDYIIQQEVPAHLLEHEQLYGSQIRILGVSDITPGTRFQIYDEEGKLVEEMSDKSLVDEYKNLHAKNITEAYNDLMRELGLDSKDESLESVFNLPVGDKRRNKILNNLENLLQRELSKDSKYNPDLRRACTLQRNSTNDPIDFTVPLLDPIQSKRIQMLINSIIKKSINKEMINGGSVVQATAYDSNLHIRFKDKNGNILKTFKEYGKSLAEFKAYLKANQAGIAYFECYMPVPNAELERLITNEDGSMMSIEEVKRKLPAEVWKSLSEVIGYRIPTEDKYSMIPLKIVGFVPKAAGQVIMMPQEITYLTGSDFDIDKMYIMMKAFDTNYGSPKEMTDSITDTYIEHLRRQGKNPFKDIKATVRQIIVNGNDIVRGRDNISWYTGIEKNEDTKALVKWYRDYLLQTLLVEYTQKYTTKRGAKKGRDNRILDLQWAVLTNKDTAPKMLNPGGFDSMKKTGRIIRIKKEGIINPATGKVWTEEELRRPEMTAKKLDKLLENSDPHNTTLPSSKIYFQHQNMQGSQMTGLIANNTVSHAFCSFQKIGIDLTKGNRDYTFALDAHTVGQPKDTFALDAHTGLDGQLISKTIATALACVLDTAKDPVASDFNLNTFTGNVAMTMVRLGFSMDIVGYLLAQPVIVELAELYFKNSTGGYYSGDSAFKEMASMLGMTSRDLADTSGIKDASVLTRDNLFNNMQNTDYRNDKKSDDFDFQKRVLQAFYRLYQIAKDVQELTFCTKFNSVTNACGPTITDTMQDYDRVQRFIEGVSESCFYEPSDDSDEYTDVRDIIFNDPILRAFYDSTVGEEGASETIFKNFFPHYFEGFKNVKKVFQEEFAGKKRISSKLYNQLLDDYIYYLLTYSDESHAPVIPSDRDAQFKLTVMILKHFLHVQRIKGRKPNLLLDNKLGNNCLRIRLKDNFLSQHILVFDSGQLNADTQQRISNAWSDLITMQDPALTEAENESIRSFGNALFFYTLMRNGFGFSSKTLMHLASVVVRYNATYSNGYNNYIVGLRNLKTLDNLLMENDNSVHIRKFIDQFIRNHSGNRSIVPNIDFQSDIIDYNNKENDTIVFKVPEEESYKLSKFMRQEDSPYKYITVSIKMGKKFTKGLYALETEGGDEIYYDDDNGVTMMKIKFRKIQSLGIPNNFIEYSANSDLEKSYFEELRSDSDASTEEEIAPKQYERDSSFENGNMETEGSIDESTRIKLARVMTELEGPQHGKEGRKYLRNLIRSIRDSSSKSDIVKNTLSLVDDSIDKDEKQSIMDKINSMFEKQEKC